MFFGLKGSPTNPFNLNWYNQDVYEYHLSGTLFRWTSPRHNDREVSRSSMFRRDNGSYNLYHIDSGPIAQEGKSLADYSRFESKYLSYHALRCGLKGIVGDIKPEVAIVNIPSLASLFRPHRFASAVEHCCFHEIKRMDGWSWHSINGTDWLQITHFVPGTKRCTLLQMWFTPITDQHMISILFCCNMQLKWRASLQPLAERDIARMMATAEVELSDTSKASQQEAREQFPWERWPETSPLMDDIVKCVDEHDSLLFRMIDSGEIDGRLPWLPDGSVDQVAYQAKRKKDDGLVAGIIEAQKHSRKTTLDTIYERHRTQHLAAEAADFEAWQKANSRL